MIYHEIAVDPASFEDFKDLGLLEKMFGFEHGRLIPFMPSKGNNWHSQVKQRLTDLYPGKSKEIELRLVQIMDRCVWRSRGATKHDPNTSWRSLAGHEHSCQEFAAILCGEEGICCHPEYSYQGMHSPPDEFPDFLRKPVHVAESLKSPDVFLENLSPLITSGSRITLIDAYLNPLPEDDGQTSVWLKSLKKLAKFLGESNRKTIDVDIHTKSPGYDATKPLNRVNIEPLDFLNQSAALIEGWFPEETKLSLTAWSERYQGQKFHARYIITNKAGVALDYGLDMRPGQRTDVSLLPLDKAKQRLGEFDWENPRLFELDGHKSFKGTR